jgi:hypothetical protein
MPQLASASLGVVNVGLAQFAETIAAAGARRQSGHAHRARLISNFKPCKEERNGR